MNQVQKPSARLIVRLVIAVCLLGTMPTITAHPKSAKAATEYAVGSPAPLVASYSMWQQHHLNVE